MDGRSVVEGAEGSARGKERGAEKGGDRESFPNRGRARLETRPAPALARCRTQEGRKAAGEKSRRRPIRRGGSSLTPLRRVVRQFTQGNSLAITVNTPEQIGLYSISLLSQTLSKGHKPRTSQRHQQIIFWPDSPGHLENHFRHAISWRNISAILQHQSRALRAATRRIRFRSP